MIFYKIYLINIIVNDLYVLLFRKMSDSDDIVVPMRKKKEPNGQKRKPGRPRKINPADVRNGISKKPEIENSLFEIKYCNPMLVQKLTTAIRKIGAQNLCLSVRPTDLFIYASSPQGVHRMLGKLTGPNMNHYYTSGSFDIGVEASLFIKTLKAIKKFYNSIMIRQERDSTNRLKFILSYNDIKVSQVIEIATTSDYEVLTHEIESLFNFIDYDITFELESCYLKSLADTMASHTEKIIITRTPGSPPVFEYDRRDGSMTFRLVIEDDGKSLHLYTKDEKLFMLTVDSEIFLEVASIEMKSNNIKVQLAENKPICILHVLDGQSFVLSFLTQTGNIAKSDRKIKYNNKKKLKEKSKLPINDILNSEDSNNDSNSDEEKSIGQIIPDVESSEDDKDIETEKFTKVKMEKPTKSRIIRKLACSDSD